MIQKVRWCPHGSGGVPVTRWCPPHAHPLVSCFVTERGLWSLRPLTSQLSSCALGRSPLVHACNSPGFLWVPPLQVAVPHTDQHGQAPAPVVAGPEHSFSAKNQKGGVIFSTFFDAVPIPQPPRSLWPVSHGAAPCGPFQGLLNGSGQANDCIDRVRVSWAEPLQVTSAS